MASLPKGSAGHGRKTLLQRGSGQFWAIRGSRACQDTPPVRPGWEGISRERIVCPPAPSSVSATVGHPAPTWTVPWLCK